MLTEADLLPLLALIIGGNTITMYIVWGLWRMSKIPYDGVPPLSVAAAVFIPAGIVALGMWKFL
jgi:hypothetical protein